jgi:hypothetical protein
MADGFVAGEAKASVDVAGGADEAFFSGSVQGGSRVVWPSPSVYRMEVSAARGRGTEIRDQNHCWPQ